MLRAATSSIFSAALVCGLTPAAAFATPANTISNADTPQVGSAYKPGEILVELDNAKTKGKKNAQSASALTKELESKLDANSIETVVKNDANGGSVLTIDLADNMSVESAVEKASKLPGVSNAQPNYVYHLLENANESTGEDGGSSPDASAGTSTSPSNSALYEDPYMSEQYYLGPWEPQEDGGSRGVNVVSAWETAIADGNVSIAVLDTGARIDHKDLAENIDASNMWDAYMNTEPGTITSTSNPYGDANGHGTHVAGIAAGVAGNDLGIAGASGNAKVVPIKVFDNQAVNPGAYTSTLVSAYRYLLQRVDDQKLSGLHVINMSLGSYASEGVSADDEALEAQIKVAKDKGIMTVCAGGNGDDSQQARTDAMYPSDYDDVLSVTALEENGTNAQWSDYNMSKDISAPGVNIYSTYNSSDEGYKSLDGTSMASPLVAGISALMWAANPDLTVNDAVAAIKDTAIKLDENGRNYHPADQTGSAGAINAAAAVEKVNTGGTSSYKRMADCTINPIDSQIWDGVNAVTPQVTVKDGETVLQENTDYTLQFTGNTTVGCASVIARGMGDYRGSCKATFDVKFDFEKASGMDLVLTKTRFTHDGEEHKPGILGVHNRPDKISTYTLSEGKDFTAEWPEDLIKAGEKTVTLTGIGDYKGTRKLMYTIAPSSSDSGYTPPSPSPTPSPSPAPTPTPTPDPTPDPEPTPDPTPTPTPTPTPSRFNLSEATMGTIADQTYTGMAISPNVKLTHNGKELVENEDYTLAYTSNINCGSVIVIATGKGNYTGSVAKRFSIIKAEQHPRIWVKSITLKARTLSKKSQNVQCFKSIKEAIGETSFIKTAGSSKITVNEDTGKATIKKGTKKGTYKLVIAVKAQGDANHMAAELNINAKIRVK